ncbi:hypothetical protein FRC04_001371 [Tulasnella sp. 424]|nr:hypothetical protein FRC04_001371 [Tulasnella sp. 424]KAG8968809.1 hypothetical protein FRC05_001295 [Tulasnella sp. 425]
MPRVPSTSSATNRPVPQHYIHTAHGNFLDSTGRVLILRGVNLSGSSKAACDRPSYELEDFWETAENGGESFVGRPLNLEDGSADVHLARLRGWGFNVIRYVVTWEALEHAGPRQYDYEFMDYTVAVLRKIKEYGFRVYMDPHQDVWSRFSGGSGAPYWTLPACGLNPRNFSASMSAIIHSEYPLPTSPEPESLPAMIWSTNYNRLISQTVWTLFFAGRMYAPKCIIDGINIQDWLQQHFVAAFGLLADRIKEAGDLYDDCVFAWDSMNEPGEGFLGLANLNETPKHQALKKGPTPTPIQSLRLGTGVPQTVENFDFGAMGPSRNGTVTIDPAGRSVWSEPSTEVDGVNQRWGWKRDSDWELGTCVWALHGVWEPSSGQALIPDYFAFTRKDPKLGQDGEETKGPGLPVDFVPDFWRPFWRKYVRRIRQAHPEAVWFIQPPVFVQPAPLEEEELRGRAAYSAHYYDGLTLMTRHWNWFNADALGLLRGKYKTTIAAVKIGNAAIRASLRSQLSILKEDPIEILGPYPTLIGEIGVPMEMDGKRAYGYTDGGKYKGDYGQQVKALDASLNGADGPNAMSYTTWTYCPDNNHQWGDGWNLEDLSLWSADDVRGARAPRMTPSRNYLRTPSSSKAQLLPSGMSRSRTSSSSSGPDEAIRQPQPTYVSGTPPRLATPAALTSAPNESAESIGSALTLANEYRLRSRTGNGVRFGDTPVPNKAGGVSMNIDPSAVSFPEFDSSSRSPPPVYTPPANPYAFLTDGARAVSAFARPYPQATVGRPKTIDFDIGKAEFTYTVIVNGGDVPDRKVDEAYVPQVTEIYLPLVHFASKQWWEDLESVPQVGGRASDSSAKEDYPPRSRSDTLASESENVPVVNSILSSSLTLGRASASGYQPHPLSPSASHYEPTIPLEAYSIAVDVSCGSWQLDSQKQILRWSYPVPESLDRDVEYTIKIKRMGGAIPRVVNGTIGQDYSTGGGQKKKGAEEGSSIWEACCGSEGGVGCTIM